MAIYLAQGLVYSAYAYTAFGFLLLPWWHVKGLARLDSAAGHGPWGFRLLISPGLVALWPWLLTRGLRGNGQPPVERNAHRNAAINSPSP